MRLLSISLTRLASELTTPLALSLSLLLICSIFFCDGSVCCMSREDIYLVCVYTHYMSYRASTQVLFNVLLEERRTGEIYIFFRCKRMRCACSDRKIDFHSIQTFLPLSRFFPRPAYTHLAQQHTTSSSGKVQVVIGLVSLSMDVIIPPSLAPPTLGKTPKIASHDERLTGSSPQLRRSIPYLIHDQINFTNTGDDYADIR